MVIRCRCSMRIKRTLKIHPRSHQNYETIVLRGKHNIRLVLFHRNPGPVVQGNVEPAGQFIWVVHVVWWNRARRRPAIILIFVPGVKVWHIRRLDKRMKVSGVVARLPTFAITKVNVTLAAPPPSE
jgi:hypothetical protein